MPDPRTGTETAPVATPATVATPAPAPPAPTAPAAVAAPAPGAGNNVPAAGTGAQIAIKVAFELDTMDGLRKVIFGLEQDIKATGPVWFIHFQLQERATNTPATTSFISVATLDVTLDEGVLQQAAADAAKKGLTTAQAGQALGPAADDVKSTTLPPTDPNYVAPADAKDSVSGSLTATD